jgi:2-alkyl-3-oxoalkanoate reductase
VLQAFEKEAAMKVFVAGASGAIGKQLVPMLVAHGHEVTGMTRTPAKQALIDQMGARPAVADGLDPEAVAQAVAEAEPEVVVNELTAIDTAKFSRSIDKMFTLTNRLRTEGTDHLLAAARAVGARRFIVQSFAGWPYERTGGPVKTEDDPLSTSPPKTVSQTLRGIRHSEEAVTGAEGIDGLALRYGGFYGPGTSIALNPDGEQVTMMRKGRLPIIGDLVAGPHRGRSVGDGRRGRAWPGGHLQRRRRRASSHWGDPHRAGEGHRGQAPAPSPALAGSADGR